MKKRKGFSLSHVHERSDLHGGTPIYGKAPRLTHAFEINRCPYNASQLTDNEKTESERRAEALAAREAFKAKRRGSKMVAKDRPRPVLKPQPPLALAVDQAAFQAELNREHWNERRTQYLDKAYTERDPNSLAYAGIRGEEQCNQSESAREAFKTNRRIRDVTSKAVTKDRSVQRQTRRA